MLLLVETAAGFALFKVLKEGKLQASENLWEDFESLEQAQKVVKLKHFQKFDNTTDALASASALVDSKLSKGLKKFLKKHAQGETLAVLDSKLGNIVKEKLGLDCVYSNAIMELARGVRNQLNGLISGLASHDLTPMSLGLSHSLSRYKLKFSPDKVDTMIVQAIGLLDDLDKEVNTYAMRVREWYGWHFPEMTKIVTDNIHYAKTIKLMGTRDKAADHDFSAIPLEEEVESRLKEVALISMGTEVSEEDMLNIMALCDQVISLADYRAQLSEYLRNRMIAIAPNLTILVGELVGARLIAHSGSLINLAKQPASTVQILGAEKALFRALKTKHETPKYGLIYHASLIGQAPPKYKGKIARALASKCSISSRYDALGESPDADIGLDGRAKVEARLRQLEGKLLGSASTGAKLRVPGKYDPSAQGASGAIVTSGKAYNPAADVANGDTAPAKKKKKKAKEQADSKGEDPVAAEPAAEAPLDAPEIEETEEPAEVPAKKKSKKRKAEGAETPADEAPKKKKKKKRTVEEA